ncbi:GNAT family N-acetyltransferase [Paenibacillus allorhizoplanae]|uniref:GNAT family N-acetyltransferase n=1 Tax=Paenibacillus allorhizoplanae TaxID=2905648 RepID=UPI001F42BEE8|nr:GNAT family N-acetyltransferase [Paenibacillus allorhizoplanae]
MGRNVGRVRRLYVSASVRRFGVGRMLVQSVIAEARNYYQILVLKPIIQSRIAHLGL